MRNYESKKIISSMNLRRNMPRKPTLPTMVEEKIEIKNEETKKEEKVPFYKLQLNGIMQKKEELPSQEKFIHSIEEKYSISKNGNHLIIENENKKVRVKLSENQMQMISVAFNL